MSEVANLTSLETADRILSILKEYSGKLAALETDARKVWLALDGSKSLQSGIEAARLICIFNALDKPVTKITQHASGLLEHSDFDHVVWWELKLRLNETELHYQLCTSEMVGLREGLIRLPDTHLQFVRRYIELTIGQKPPF